MTYEKIGELVPTSDGRWIGKCAQCEWEWTYTAVSRSGAEGMLRRHDQTTHPQPIPVYRSIGGGESDD